MFFHLLKSKNQEDLETLANVLITFINKTNDGKTILNNIFIL